MIVTFYSFKGGVGRSMAVVNVAEVLADQGYRVIVCDWDLEAPGLERYFTTDSKSADALLDRPGIIDLLEEYKASLGGTKIDPRDDESAFADVNGLRIRKPSRLAILPTATSRIRLLSAGRRDSQYKKKYTQAVQSFSWFDFYQNWVGGSYIEFLRQDLDKQPETDIVLIDSRTGVTEQGGVCTHHLADFVVVLTAANDLNLDGAEWMLDLLAVKEGAPLRKGRRLGTLPVASRVEQLSERGLTKTFRKSFQDRFFRFLPPELERRESFLLDSEIPHVPAFGFEERVIAREPDRHLEKQVFGAYVRIADAIVTWGNVHCNLRRIANETTGKDHPVTLFLSCTADDASEGEQLEAAVDRHKFRLVGLRGDADQRRRELALAGAAVIVVPQSGRPIPLDSEIRDMCVRKETEPSFEIGLLVSGKSAGSAVPLALSDCAKFNLEDQDWQEQLYTALRRANRLPSTRRRLGIVGLRAFGPDDGIALFGRDDDVRALLPRIERGGLTLVTGDSGVGKNSLVAAGLVPAVQRRLNECQVVQFDASSGGSAPGENPPASPGIVEQIKPLMNSPSDKGRRLIIVYRAERLLASPEARDFVSETQRSRNPSVTLLLVTEPPLRKPTAADEDFWRQCVNDTIVVSRLRREPLMQVARGLLTISGLKTEQGLVEVILSDIGEGPASLAFLQHCLQRLYEGGRESLLTHEGYRAVGRFAGLLQIHAESIFSMFQREQEQSIARRMLTKLVRPGDGGSDSPRSAALDELLGMGFKNDTEAAVLRTLIDGRLITLSQAKAGDIPTVELSHPSLLECWSRFRQWIDEGRAQLRVVLDLSLAAQRWQDHSRRSAYLYRGADLAKAEEYSLKIYQGLSGLERDFLKRSRWKRIQRSVIWSAVPALAILGVLFIRNSERILLSLGLKEPERYEQVVGGDALLVEDFAMTATAKPSTAIWDYPPEKWTLLLSSRGDNPSDGLLVAEAADLGVLRFLTPNTSRALYDFRLKLTVSFENTMSAAWEVRVQGDRKSGYLFIMQPSGTSLVLEGFLMNGAERRSLGIQQLLAESCCSNGDHFDVQMDVKGFDFSGTVSWRQPLVATPEILTREYLKPELNVEHSFRFSDDNKTFAWGNVGFSAAPDGSATRIDRVTIGRLK